MKRYIQLLLLLIAVGSVAVVQAQESETRIVVHPLTSHLGIGDQSTILFEVVNTEPLYGYDIRFRFNPSVINLIDTDDSMRGVQLEAGEFFAQAETTFVLLNEGDNELGEASYAMVLVNPEPAIAGSGVLFSLPFRVVGNGDAELEVAESTLGTKEIEHVPHIVETATLQIGRMNPLWIGFFFSLIMLICGLMIVLYLRQRKAVVVPQPAANVQDVRLDGSSQKRVLEIRPKNADHKHDPVSLNEHTQTNL